MWMEGSDEEPAKLKTLHDETEDKEENSAGNAMSINFVKMALRAPQSKNGVQKPRETPPKMVG